MEPIVSSNSDNDWLRRAGIRWENGQLILPHAFLVLPMTIASKAVVSYNSDDSLANRIAQALIISVMVRSADTAFFTAIANQMNAANPSQPNICHNCLRGQLFQNRLKELRALVNKKIIHKVEDGSGIGPTSEHIPLAIEYYDEMFTLPLVPPTSWEERSGIQLCQRCAPKWKNAYA